MNLNAVVAASLRGRYHIRHLTHDGFLKNEYTFDNLITDTGLNQIGAEGLLFQFCHLSTSTATPAVTDSTMGGTTVRTSSISPIFTNSCTVGASPDYERTLVLGYRFNAGTATGTWASIGIGYNNADSGIVTKTRIRDAGGTPTTITVLAGEILDVSYELHAKTNVSLGSGTVSGVGYTVQPYNLATAFPSSAIQLVTWTSGFQGVLYGASSAISHGATNAGSPFTGGSVASFSSGSANSTTPAYVPGTFYRDLVFAWGTTATHANNLIYGIGIQQATATIIGSGWGFKFNTPQGKTNLQNANFTCRISWARA